MLEDFLPQLPQLKRRSLLEIPADILEEASVDALIDALKEMPQLREINFLNGRMGRLNLDRLAELQQVSVFKWINTGERKRTPTGIFCMENLRSLEIRQSDFRLIPDEIGQLSNLRQFRFQGNRTGRLILEISEQIGSLPSLETLEISNVYVEKIPETLEQAKQLQKLGFYNCERLYTLPECIGRLPKLKTLELVNNAIRKLPENIGDLKELEALDLTENSFTQLPDSFCALEKLEKLSLDKCRFLEELPKNFTQLNNLRSLKINNEKLDYDKALQQIIALPNLEILELLRYDDRPFSLPSNFAAMHSLKWLRLKVGKMDIQQALTVISRLPNLQYLDLYGFDLSSVPECFKNLDKLQSIRLSTKDMQGEDIAKLFVLLGQLPDLRRINLSRSAKYIPREIGLLPKLEVLDVSFCPMLDLPQELFQMRNLVSLNVQGCKLQEAELGKLRACLPECNISG